MIQRTLKEELENRKLEKEELAKEIGAESQPLLAKFGATEDWADEFPYKSSRLRPLPWQ